VLPHTAPRKRRRKSRPLPADAAALARHALRGLAVMLCCGLACLPSQAQTAGALIAKQAALHEQLAQDAAGYFGKPLVLTSTVSDSELQGEVYAVVDQPYSAVRQALSAVGAWCDVLMLHLNDKACSWHLDGSHTLLSLSVVRRFDQAPADAFMIDFGWQMEAGPGDYLRVQLAAAQGPLGTKNYRLLFEAVALDAKSSFVHLSYAYGMGTLARLATQAYLATAGHAKLGFSVAGHDDQGRPMFVGDEQGLIERNAMRHYLAIEATLRAGTLPAGEQAEQRMALWFDATERYPAQLHEMGRDEYLVMKRRELGVPQR
jgi:hypothetical protein